MKVLRLSLLENLCLYKRLHNELSKVNLLSIIITRSEFKKRTGRTSVLILRKYSMFTVH